MLATYFTHCLWLVLCCTVGFAGYHVGRLAEIRDPTGQAQRHDRRE